MRRRLRRWGLGGLLFGAAGQLCCNVRGSARGVTAGEAVPPAAADSGPATAPGEPSDDPNGTPPTTPVPAPQEGNDYFGSPRCAGAAVALCDSFEDASPGDPPSADTWKVVTTGSGSSVVVDTKRAARGKQSVHVHTANQGYAQAVITPARGLPLPGGVLWGRAFVYYASDGNLPQMHWTLFEGSGALPGKTAATLARYGGQFTHLMANYFGADQYAHAGDPVAGGWANQTLMPAGRWACFEWQFKVAGNEMHLYLDGTEVKKIAIFGISTQCCPDQPWIIPTMTDMNIGWQIYQMDATQGASFDMWVDEVALDVGRIGCSR